MYGSYRTVGTLHGNRYHKKWIEEEDDFYINQSKGYQIP